LNHEKPIALWSVPRSISTAFEGFFVERDDFEVLHELDRASRRYSDEEPEAGYEEVLAEVPRPRERRIFHKSSSSVVGPGLFCHRHTRPTPKTGWRLPIHLAAKEDAFRQT
jgi:hypothetical protein